MEKSRAHLRYIARPSATGHHAEGAVLLRTDGQTVVAPDGPVARRAFLGRIDAAIDARAANHRARRGVRLIDKGIVSLPSDANAAQCFEMTEALAEEFGGNSEAHVVAALHRDRRGNPHVHLLMIDGKETAEAASERAEKRRQVEEGGAFLDGRKPKKTRVRRQDHLRLGELGSRAAARLRAAAVVNRIAVRDGLRCPETRSLSELGIERPPQKHTGPQAAEKGRRARPSKLTEWVAREILSQCRNRARYPRCIGPARHMGCGWLRSGDTAAAGGISGSMGASDASCGSTPRYAA